MSRSPCKIYKSRKKKDNVIGNTDSSSSFQYSIPVTIRDEINQVVRLTSKTDREQSLTFCRLKDQQKIFVANYATGNINETEVKPCNSEYGNTEKIGDLHTHPTQDKNTVGITPSIADITSTITESKKEGVSQISCITGPDAKFIHCYQPKPRILMDDEKMKNYKRLSNYMESSVTDVPPFIRENVAQDLDHALYDRKTFHRVKNPRPKDIVHDAFLNSRKLLKFKEIPNLDKGAFCDIIEDLNYPDKDKVSIQCRKALNVREFLGFQY